MNLRQDSQCKYFPKYVSKKKVSTEVVGKYKTQILYLVIFFIYRYPVFETVKQKKCYHQHIFELHTPEWTVITRTRLQFRKKYLKAFIYFKRFKLCLFCYSNAMLLCIINLKHLLKMHTYLWLISSSHSGGYVKHNLLGCVTV